MTRTAFLAICAIAALGTTCLGASAFDQDGRAPAARAGSRPAAGDGQATSIEIGRSSVGIAGGNGAAVAVGGNAVSVGGGKGGGVVVSGDGSSVVVGGNGVSVGGRGARVVGGGDGSSVVVGRNGVSVGGRGAGVVVGGDGTSVVVGGNGVSVGGRGTGVVVDGTSVVVGGNGVSVSGGNGASVVVGGNGAAVGVGAGVVVAPGSGPRVVTQAPGFKAMAVSWNSSGAWVVRSSPTLEGASADALQICNNEFGGCTLSDARVTSTTFGCLAVAQSDNADHVFVATGNSPDAARVAVSDQVTSAGLHGHFVYAACNY